MLQKPIAIALLFAVAMSPSIARADPPTPVRATPNSDAQAPIYRFDFTLRRPDDPAGARLPTYSITLEEHGTGAIAVGSNIPLSATPGSVSPRQDVGLMLRFSYSLRGNVVVLTCNAELSTAESTPGTPASIHHVRAQGVVPLTPGHPALFTSVPDINSRRPFEITITATRVL